MTIRKFFVLVFLWILLGCGQSAYVPVDGIDTAPSAKLETVTGELRCRLTDAALNGVRVGWEGTNLFTRTDQEGRFSIKARRGFEWLSIAGDSVIRTRWKPQPIMHVWTKARNEDAERRYLIERPPMDSDPLDDPDLTDRARLILRSGEFFSDDLSRLQRPRFLLKQALQPPETVRVYRRGPENNSCEGRVDVIPLEEYVRGVVPHEWISSWHEESLRAGAIAARSYAWGWILAGGKFDCADLDDTTRSQVYEDTRNERTDVAVMSTAGIGIYDPDRGQVVKSEYSAENADPTEFGVCEPLCTGETLFGHGRGMCQWGTSRWSSRQITEAQSEVLANCAVTSPAPIVGTGQIAEWMVAHYFPGKYTSELQDTGASLQLSQSLERLTPFNCTQPNRGLGCSDFVPEGPSEGIFDTFLGQSTLITYRVGNEGSSHAADVVWSMQKPDGVDVEISSDAGTIDEVNGVLTARFDRLESGEHVAVELRITPIASGGLLFKPFISQIQNQYDKRGWDSEPELNVGQTYNSGDLRQLTEIDVFNPKRWDFRSAQELNPIGWHGESVSYEAVDTGMKISSGDADTDAVSIVSPYLFGDRSGVDLVMLRSSDPVTVAVRHSEEDQFEVLGTGSGTRAFELSMVTPVYQLRLSGASPFTVESVGLRSRVGGESGSDEPFHDEDVSVPQRPGDSDLMRWVDGGLDDVGVSEPLSAGGVRGSGSCMHLSVVPKPYLILSACIVVCAFRRRKRR